MKFLVHCAGMEFWRFVFSFLYVRNWYNGQMELSRPRVALFASALFLFMLAFTIIAILQAPIEYATQP
jgi:hypothetical protein